MKRLFYFCTVIIFSLLILFVSCSDGAKAGVFDSSNRTSDDIDLLFTNIDENIMGNDWYSLSTEEWTYLLYERENAKN